MIFLWLMNCLIPIYKPPIINKIDYLYYYLEDITNWITTLLKITILTLYVSRILTWTFSIQFPVANL